MLELYHHGSSACAAKVRFAFAEKRLDWTGRYVDILKGEQFAPEFLAISPKAVVPVLVHDGRIIPESTVICEYVEEVFADHPIYPVDPFERAQVRLWTKAVDEELHPACSAITYVVSHRHTILRNGVGDFETFLKTGARDGSAARTLKWHWIQEGLAAPGAADKIRLYDTYLQKMEKAPSKAATGSRGTPSPWRTPPWPLTSIAFRPWPWTASGRKVADRGSRPGSSECATDPPFTRPSCNGCRRAWRMRCSPTASARGLRSRRCSGRRTA